ncbi:MAG: divalent-cation tolerance protein CutA [Methyloligellaceae bacterium]
MEDDVEDRDAVILLYTTLASADEAKALAHALIGKRLAACANISAPMTAVYEWEGEVREEAEVAMLLKSRAALQEDLLAEARRLHPYETPALIILHPAAADAAFCDWIIQQTATDSGGS